MDKCPHCGEKLGYNFVRGKYLICPACFKSMGKRKPTLSEIYGLGKSTEPHVPVLEQSSRPGPRETKDPVETEKEE